MKKMSILLASLMAVTLLVPTVSSAKAISNPTSSVITQNTPPDVEVFSPPSKDPYNPTILKYGDPILITWSQTDPDPNTVFKTFWVEVIDNDTGRVYSSGVLPQNTSNNFQSFVIPKDKLPSNRLLYVGVSIQDEAGNWNYGSSVNYFKIQQP
ncbi:hypothetical protein HP567_012665 [Brevibacillus sp. M2.1A]|uniref:hypothetical protein n=1 Tax=Brevibacillus TaxID=55080 RepID=UPI00156B073E|nr:MULTISPECIES: hypothetical protein [Brevibacillus]MBY0088186.1 hypothetical protein [Brevibacillus brevis]MCC8435399.1 hypothetical protein [Brevibacillus sp. M2.1A]